MLHSIKYKIPAVVVMSREEALADRRRNVMNNVLDSTLPADKKIRLYESTLARRLNEEEKLIDTPIPPSLPQDVALANPLEALSPAAQENIQVDDADDFDNFDASLFDQVSPVQSSVAVSPKSSVKSASWHKVTPKGNRKTPKNATPKATAPGRRSTLPPPRASLAPQDSRRSTLTPNYMKPLDRKKKITDPSDASPVTLRPDRPPPGYFKGRGRLSVVRW